jgi:hypothetical protein
MRKFVLLAVSLLLVGCSTFTDRVSQRFSANAPVERVLNHDKLAVYLALQQVLEEQGYLVTRAAEAQGIIEARSRRLPTEQFGASQQYHFEIRLRSAIPGITTVEARLREQTEGDFAAGATSTPLHAHGRYEALFEVLEQRLAGGQ